jgi:hypothetical protein
MRLIDKVIPRDANLFMFSCTHWGSTFTHVSGWQQLVDMMNSSYEGLPEKSNFGLHHGDLIEGKLIDHPHFVITGSEPGGVLPQMRHSVNNLRPIATKLIAILQGNHERKLIRFGDIGGFVADELGVPFGTGAAKIRYLDETKSRRTVMFKQYCIHGAKQVKSNADDIVREQSNMKLSLKRQLKREAGDTILMTKGHTHHLLHLAPTPQLYLVDTRKKLKQRYTETRQDVGFIHPDLRWYVNVGAFFRKYGDELIEYDVMDPMHSARSSYVEENEYPPIELGFAVVLVRDGKVVGVQEEVVD